MESRADYNYVHKIHNIKIGTQLMQTRLHERFSLGITQPGFTAINRDWLPTI